MKQLDSNLNANEQNNINGTSRTQQIKTYLKRLGEGEDLESVRKDFAEEFKEVDAAEIMQAEQELLRREHRLKRRSGCAMYILPCSMEQRGRSRLPRRKKRLQHPSGNGNWQRQRS